MSMATYYQLTKPGIVFGNLVTVLGGYALAAEGQMNLLHLTGILFGTSFVVAAACVCNNYKDRDYDAKMERTKARPLAARTFSPKKALYFAQILLLVGSGILLLVGGQFSFLAGLIGFGIYVFLYTPQKQRSEYATFTGSLAGAAPPLIGYLALQPFDSKGIALFCIVAIWQMPHFLAIALYRMEEYAAANIPVFPLRKGVFATKIHMLIYTFAFLIGVLSLSYLRCVGNPYLFIAGASGLGWLALCLRGFRTENIKNWAKSMFVFSLVNIVVWNVMLIIDVKNFPN